MQERKSPAHATKTAASSTQTPPPANDATPSHNREVILVTGMHRSGTSMLTGVLSRLGCNAGQGLMPANFANERGYYEPLSIAQLNDRILESAGTRWDDWQTVNPGWFSSILAEQFKQEALKTLDSEFGDSRLLVLKDPRICRFLPFWCDVFEEWGASAKILHIHRNPLEVGASLKARDGMSVHYAYLLWLRHTLDAEQASRKLPRYFTSFDQLIKNWSGVTSAAAAELGLSWPRMSAKVINEVQDFVAPDLKHFNLAANQLVQDPQIFDWVKETFEIFERWSEQNTKPEDLGALDMLRQSLDHSTTVFSGLLEERAQTLANLQTTNDDMHSQLQKSLAHSDELTKKITQSETQIVELSAKLKQRHAESDYWSQRIEELTQGLEDQRKDIVDHVAEAEHWASHAAKREADIVALEFQQQTTRHEFDQKIRALEAKLEEERKNLHNQLAAQQQSQTETHARHMKEKEYQIEQYCRKAEEEAARQHRELKDARALIKTLRFDKEQLLNSTSWRLTAPLRRLVDAIRQ